MQSGKYEIINVIIPEHFIKPVLTVVAIAMLVWILFWMIFSFSKKHRTKISFSTEIIFFLFYIYAIGVMSLTIFPLPFERFKTPNEDGINTTPVIKTLRGLSKIQSNQDTLSSEHIFQNIFGNIILFIPLGIFLPLLFHRCRSLKKVIIISSLCSLSIELTQLILRQFEIYRTVDIDDVILNTLGAILGFILINSLYFKRVKLY